MKKEKKEKLTKNQKKKIKRHRKATRKSKRRKNSGRKKATREIIRTKKDIRAKGIGKRAKIEKNTPIIYIYNQFLNILTQTFFAFCFS